jgi:predicted kinase
MTLSTPTLFMLCGLPGSGKTTLARHLACSGTRCFILDEMVASTRREATDDLIERVAEAAWPDIAETLCAGRDVVLDWGFDSREERDRTRARATAVGATVRLFFLDVPKAELSRRLASRRWPCVTEEELERWSAQFDTPGPDEGYELPAEDLAPSSCSNDNDHAPSDQDGSATSTRAHSDGRSGR